MLGKIRGIDPDVYEMMLKKHVNSNLTEEEKDKKFGTGPLSLDP